METEVRLPPSTSPPPPPTSTIFAALQLYPFASDPDFEAGLASLTSSPTLTGDTNALNETILQARCFYFARKYLLPPIDVEEYKSWLSRSQEGTAPPKEEIAQDQDHEHPTHIAAQPLSQSQPTPAPIQLYPSSSSSQPAPSSSDPGPEAGPPYPASFESIVDLITRNQPIPGIEEIPDTVLDASLSAPNQTARRKKPWETDDAVKDIAPVLGDGFVSQDGKPTGVVGILQPIKKLEEGEGTNPGALEDKSTATLDGANYATGK